MIREEHGAALVTVMLWLPLLVLFPIFVIDVGNWFGHHRHLQTQADAAALAAAGDLATSFGAAACDDKRLRRHRVGRIQPSARRHIAGRRPPDAQLADLLQPVVPD